MFQVVFLFFTSYYLFTSMQVIISNGEMVHLVLVIIIHEPFNCSLIKIIFFLVCNGVISLVVFLPFHFYDVITST